MTSAVHSGELLAQREAEMQDAGVPANILACAKQFGGAAVQFGLELDASAEKLSELENGREEGLFLGQFVEDLVVDGRLTSQQAWQLCRLAGPISTMFAKTEFKGKVLDGDNPISEASTQLGHQITEYFLRTGGNYAREQRRHTVIEPVAKQFLDIAVNISKSGGYLLAGQDTDAVLASAKRRQNDALSGQDSTAREVIESGENPELLLVLSLIDFFTYARELPQDLAKKFAEEDGINMDPAGYMTMLLATSLRDPKAYKDILQTLFAGQPKKMFSGKLKGANGELFDKGMQLPLTMLAVLDYGTEIGELVSRSSEQMQRRIGEVGQTVHAVSGDVERKHATLMEMVRLYVEEDATPERVLGALSIENWVEALILDIEPDEDPRELRPFHDAIESEHMSQQLAELEQVIDPLKERIADIEEKYAISSQVIRGFDGGLDLRRLVELWQEPGSNKAIFGKGQSQQLAGISLQLRDNPKPRTQFKHDFTELREAWADLAFLQYAGRRSGLIRNLDTLAELYESASDKQRKDGQLKPLWDLAELFASPVAVADDTGEATESKEHGWKVPKEFEKIEFIEAFPPGPANAIADDLREISKGWSGDPIEWERVDELVQLRGELIQSGFEVKTLRLMQTLWHPLPHYVIEATAPNGRVVAVVESPIYGNATYIIPGDNWRKVVKSAKKVIRDTDQGFPKPHSAQSTPYDHRQKLKKSAIESV